MGEMTKKERVGAALAGQMVDRPPVSLWGHDFLREWTPEDLVASTMDSYRAGDWDFIKFNPRATYFAEAWGNAYEPPSEQRQPRLKSARVVSAGEFGVVSTISGTDGVFGEHLRALRMLIETVGEDVDVIHTVFSPLAVTAQLCGSDAKFREFAEADGGAAHAAVDAVTRSLRAYARAALDAGASGIFFAPLLWASRDHSDAAFYGEFGRPYDLRVLEATDGAPFNVLHVCRNNNMVEALLDYPVSAFNWADRAPGNPSLTDVRARTDKAVIGGIDHARLHQMTPDDVRAQVREALAQGAERILIGGGCAIPPATPDANRAAASAAVREFVA